MPAITEDLSSERIGALVVEGRVHQGPRGALTWRCLCDCGTREDIRAWRLVRWWKLRSIFAACADCRGCLVQDRRELGRADRLERFVALFEDAGTLYSDAWREREEEALRRLLDVPEAPEDPAVAERSSVPGDDPAPPPTTLGYVPISRTYPEGWRCESCERLFERGHGCLDCTAVLCDDCVGKPLVRRTRGDACAGRTRRRRRKPRSNSQRRSPRAPKAQARKPPSSFRRIFSERRELGALDEARVRSGTQRRVHCLIGAGDLTGACDRKKPRAQGQRLERAQSESARAGLTRAILATSQRMTVLKKGAGSLTPTLPPRRKPFHQKPKPKKTEPKPKAAQGRQMWPLPVAREGAENVFAAQLSVPPNEWRLLLSGTIYRAVIEVHAPGRFHLLLFGDVEYEQFRSTGVPDPYGTCLKRTGYVKFDFQTTQPDLGAHVVLANPNNHAMFAGFSCRTADKLDYFPHGADWRP